MFSLPVRTAQFAIRMIRDRDVGIAAAVMKAFGNCLEEAGGNYSLTENYQQATVLVTDSETEATRALHDGKRVLFIPLSDQAELPETLTTGYDGRIGLIWGERPTITDTASAVSQFGLRDPSKGTDGVDWVRVPEAVRQQPLPIEPPPDWINNFRFVCTADGFADDGSLVVSPERGYVDDSDERERLLAYIRGGAVVVDNMVRGPDLIDPTRQFAVPAWFRTDGMYVWPASVEYYLRWHNLAPEPEFRAQIARNGYMCPPVEPDVVAAARAATDNRAWLIKGRIDAYRDAHPELRPGDPKRFPEINDTLLALGWQRGRDLRAEVDDWLAGRMTGLPANLDGAPYAPFEAAVAVMREFGGLFSLANGPGRTSAQIPFTIYPQPSDELAGFAPKVQQLGQVLNTRVFQIGEVEHGIGALVIDETGRIFFVGPVALFAGANIDEALNRMLQGIRCEKLHEIDRNHSSARRSAAEVYDEITSLEALLAEDLRRGDANAAANRTEKIFQLAHPDDWKARFDALSKRYKQLYVEGKDKRANFYLEVAVATARRAAALAQAPRERYMALCDLGAMTMTLGEYEGAPKRFEEAVVAYREALKDCVRERFPRDWAEIKLGIGRALSWLGERETEYLDEAVVVFREAMRECTRERNPVGWAEAQLDLGVALQRLGEREMGTTRLIDAVEAYGEALKEYGREKFPLKWAETQTHLANALVIIGEREGTMARLLKGVAMYREALKELTRERDPLGWAQIQSSLGNALFKLGEQNPEERGSGTASLKEAVVAHREALKELTRERDPRAWAMAQNNLGNALSEIGQREDETARLEEGIAAYREALKEWTRERDPIQWAQATGYQGVNLFLIAGRKRQLEMAETAIQQMEAALRAARDDANMPLVDYLEKILPEARALLVRLKSH